MEVTDTFGSIVKDFHSVAELKVFSTPNKMLWLQLKNKSSSTFKGNPNLLFLEIVGGICPVFNQKVG